MWGIRNTAGCLWPRNGREAKTTKDNAEAHESPETRGELVRDVGVKPRGAVACVLDFRVYANGNYWTTTGWEDYLVPDFNQGFGRGERWVAGDSCGCGEGAGAAVD